METTNTHWSISRTLAVIDGGSNFKATVQTQPAIHKPKLLEQSGKRSERGSIVI